MLMARDEAMKQRGRQTRSAPTPRIEWDCSEPGAVIMEKDRNYAVIDQTSEENGSDGHLFERPGAEAFHARGSDREPLQAGDRFECRPLSQGLTRSLTKECQWGNTALKLTVKKAGPAIDPTPEDLRRTSKKMKPNRHATRRITSCRGRLLYVL